MPSSHPQSNIKEFEEKQKIKNYKLHSTNKIHSTLKIYNLAIQGQRE